MATVTVTTTATATGATQYPTQHFSDPSSPGHSVSTGVVVAISVVLALLTLLLIAFGIWFLCIRKRKRRAGANPVFTGNQASALAYDELQRRGVGPGQTYPLSTTRSGAGRAKGAVAVASTEQQNAQQGLAREDQQQHAGSSTRQRAVSLNSDISGNSFDDYDDGPSHTGGGTGGVLGGAMGGSGGAGDAARGVGGNAGSGAIDQQVRQYAAMEHYAPAAELGLQQQLQQGRQGFQPAREHFAPPR